MKLHFITIIILLLCIIISLSLTCYKLQSPHKILVLSEPYKTNIIDKSIPFTNKQLLKLKVIELHTKNPKQFELPNTLFNIKNLHKGDTLYMSRLSCRITSIHKLITKPKQ